jgi:hypothetical protein
MSWSWGLSPQWRLLAWGKTPLLHPVHLPMALPQVFQFRKTSRQPLACLSLSHITGRPLLPYCPNSLPLRLEQAPMSLEKATTVSSLTT